MAIELAIELANLSMGGAGHVGPIDLNDLITRLEAAVTGHQALREHLLNMASYCVRRLEHERPSMATRPSGNTS